MKALILAAGLGTRLLPLTSTIPKALVCVDGVSLLELTIRKLASEGYDDIIVNVHHHAGQVIDFLKQKSFAGINISISDESDELLDTGGAILKAQGFLDGKEPFLVHNVDVISDISLTGLLATHRSRGGLATLSVIDRPTRRYFLFDDELRLTGWINTDSGETRWANKPFTSAKRLAFSGIHMISPEIFKLMDDKGRFSIIDTYLTLSANHSLYGYIQPGCTWFDLGKPEQLQRVSGFLKDHPELTIKL